MENEYIKKELEQIYSGVSRRREERNEKLKLQRNVAAIVDFVSNLYNVIGHSMATPSFKNSGNRNKSFNKYDSNMRDFKGSIAGDMFRARFISRTGSGSNNKNNIGKVCIL